MILVDRGQKQKILHSFTSQRKKFLSVHILLKSIWFYNWSCDYYWSFIWSETGLNRFYIKVYCKTINKWSRLFDHWGLKAAVLTSFKGPGQFSLPPFQTWNIEVNLNLISFHRLFSRTRLLQKWNILVSALVLIQSRCDVGGFLFFRSVCIWSHLLSTPPPPPEKKSKAYDRKQSSNCFTGHKFCHWSAAETHWWLQALLSNMK